MTMFERLERLEARVGALEKVKEALDSVVGGGVSSKLRSSLTAHAISAQGGGGISGRVVERGELTEPVMQERVERCWDAINRRWGGATLKSRLTREDSFKEMRMFDAEQVALEAARRWMSLWNEQGPEEDSVHRELYEAMVSLARARVATEKP